MRWNNYHYLHTIHFVFIEFRGTKDECMDVFNKQRKQYSFATTIASSDFSDHSYVLIRRFVSKEACDSSKLSTYLCKGR